MSSVDEVLESSEARQIRPATLPDGAFPAAGTDRRAGYGLTGQAVIFLVSLAVYAALPTRNFNYADDALSWAYQLTRPDGLINSHHLYLNAMRVVLQQLSDAGLNVDPVGLLAFYSALWGATGLVVLYRLLVRAGLDEVAVWAIMFCAFSAGYWSYSIVGDVYVPATSAMLLGFYLVYTGLTSDSRRTARWCAFGAVVAFVAMLAHHQAYVMVVLGLVPAVFLMRKPLCRCSPATFGVLVPAAVCASAVLLSTPLAIAVLTGDWEISTAAVSGMGVLTLALGWLVALTRKTVTRDEDMSDG